MNFYVCKKDGTARCGILKIGKNDAITTPTFMAVGTSATVKGLQVEDIIKTNTRIVLSNTYHLMIRPGAETIYQMGGLHNFMNWNGPILTDSGGYQVMSLAKLCCVSDDGATFQSHIDGKKFFLSPEKSIEIQCLLGSNIQMTLDQCVAYNSSKDTAHDAMERSLKWGQRCQEAFAKKENIKACGDQDRTLFGITQGGFCAKDRIFSATNTVNLNFDGYAIGGLAVGEPKSVMNEMLKASISCLPENKPRYLMGVGMPLDLIESIKCGVDMFDCVIPTRAGRHGLAFTKNGKIVMKNAQWARDHTPLDSESTCRIARTYTKSYLHHLIKNKEILGSVLLSIVNLSFYQEFMHEIQKSIINSEFHDFYLKFMAGPYGANLKTVQSIPQL